jgi:hypothetical protein
LQADLLARAGEREQQVRELSDDTLQVLFATNLVIGQLKADAADLPLHIFAVTIGTTHAFYPIFFIRQVYFKAALTIQTPIFIVWHKLSS